MKQCPRPRVSVSRYLDENGVEHESTMRQDCTLEFGHVGDCAFGMWYSPDNYATVTVQKRSATDPPTED